MVGTKYGTYRILLIPGSIYSHKDAFRCRMAAYREELRANGQRTAVCGAATPGDYAVRRPNSQRASDVLPTQAEAIERARQLNPDTQPAVERVRNTSRGHPDKWRKP